MLDDERRVVFPCLLPPSLVVTTRGQDVGRGGAILRLYLGVQPVRLPSAA